MESIVALILNESRWLFAAMLVSMVAVGIAVARLRRSGLAGQRVIATAMSMFYGCLIGVMGSGHLLAVTIKLFQGNLDGTPWPLYALGLVLALPSWWLVLCATHGPGRKVVALNAWVGGALLVLGVHNAPLAAPALLNIAYRYHSRRVVGWLILAATVAIYLALLIGSLVFLASGQSFEQFQGME